MVGMPYPNIRSPELQEKMAYLDQTLVSTSNVLTPSTVVARPWGATFHYADVSWPLQRFGMYLPTLDFLHDITC